jgi:AcrR family transcriptional regulator
MSEQARKRLGRPPASANQRGRILETAALVFARSGFEQSNITDISEQMGISKGGIYHYFKSKQEVYDEIIVQTLRGLHAYVDAALADVHDPADRFVVFMIKHAEYFERNYWSFIAMLSGFRSISSPATQEEAIALRERHEHMLRRIIADGVAQRRFRAVDPSVAGRAALSLLNWMARWFRPDGPQSAAEIAREYADLLFVGLRHPDAPE